MVHSLCKIHIPYPFFLEMKAKKSSSVAGSETTANELSGLTARLLKNPLVYKKLTEEIRTNFKHESELTDEKLSKLPYLGACLSEGLRIHPPLPTALMRTVPKDGDTIDGHW